MDQQHNKSAQHHQQQQQHTTSNNHRHTTTKGIQRTPIVQDLIHAVKTAHALPAQDDHEYFLSFKAYRTLAHAHATHLLTLLKQSIHAADAQLHNENDPAATAADASSSTTRTTTTRMSKAPWATDSDAQFVQPRQATTTPMKDCTQSNSATREEDRFRTVDACVDALLHAVNLQLDKIEGDPLNSSSSARSTDATRNAGAAAAVAIDISLGGLHKRASSKVPSSIRNSGTSKNRASRKLLSKTLNILKPQRKFKDGVNNAPSYFVPIIRHKPHALEPLHQTITDAQQQQQQQHLQEQPTTPKKLHSLPSPSPALSPAVVAHVVGNLGVPLPPPAAPSAAARSTAAAVAASHGGSADASAVAGRSPGSSAHRKPLALEHPYKCEIEHLRYATAHLQPRPEILYTPVDEQTQTPPCKWIDAYADLKKLITELSMAAEIAVDLEHHSYRSFYGFTCLMQISTRSQDYLIDTIALRSELHELNCVFANPNIVKVLHGANMDVQWLQRDFGIYIVNLFDTGQAARVLEYRSFGLAHLLSHFCDIEADKKYQLADWRQRPLTAEMMYYARQDTHYLLYIADRLRNELCTVSARRSLPFVSYHVADLKAKTKGILSEAATQTGDTCLVEVPLLLHQAIKRSQEIALIQYEHPQPPSHGANKAFAEKFELKFTQPQMQVLQALLTWRDMLARLEDESLGYVMPNHLIINICTNMPYTEEALLSISHSLPVLVRREAGELVQLISAAKERTPRGRENAQFLSSSLLSVDDITSRTESARLPIPSTSGANFNDRLLDVVPVARHSTLWCIEDAGGAGGAAVDYGDLHGESGLVSSVSPLTHEYVCGISATVEAARLACSLLAARPFQAPLLLPPSPSCNERREVDVSTETMPSSHSKNTVLDRKQRVTTAYVTPEIQTDNVPADDNDAVILSRQMGAGQKRRRIVGRQQQEKKAMAAESESLGVMALSASLDRSNKRRKR